MKREFDLIKRILLAVEALPGRKSVVRVSDIDGVDEAAAYHHMMILIDAGFVKGDEGYDTMASAFLYRLTWQGHDFLDSIR